MRVKHIIYTQTRPTTFVEFGLYVTCTTEKLRMYREPWGETVYWGKTEQDALFGRRALVPGAETFNYENKLLGRHGGHIDWFVSVTSE